MSAAIVPVMEGQVVDIDGGIMARRHPAGGLRSRTGGASRTVTADRGYGEAAAGAAVLSDLDVRSVVILMRPTRCGPAPGRTPRAFGRTADLRLWYAQAVLTNGWIRGILADHIAATLVRLRLPLVRQATRDPLCSTSPGRPTFGVTGISSGTETQRATSPRHGAVCELDAGPAA